MYFAVLALGLCAALLLNARQLRSIALVTLAAVFLLGLPAILPDPNAVQEWWFAMLVLAELLCASLALMINARISGVFAALSVFNATTHTLGLLAYSYDWPLYGLYEGLVRGGEISQVLALIILSEPFKRAVYAIVDSKKGSSGGQPRLRLQLA